MKKITLIVVLIVVAISISSCSSRKKGCGLTGSLQTVEYSVTTENAVNQ